MHNIFSKKDGFRFFGVILAFVIGWAVLSSVFSSTFDTVNYAFTAFQSHLSSFALSLFGLLTESVSTQNELYYRLIDVNDNQMHISHHCNGFSLLIVFSALILALPGKPKPKLLFLVFGNALIVLVNVIRICLLFLNYRYFPAWIDFNHKYTFTFLVYGFIFMLWRYYAKKWMSAPGIAQKAS